MPRPRYIRYRTYERARYSRRFATWIDAQSERLGMTSQDLFNDLLVGQGMTYEQIEAMPTPEPEPEE